jgi:hypothetical protein
MAGQKVIAELFPEADYIFYPGLMPPSLAQIYKTLRTQGNFAIHKHLWVEIIFLSDRSR